MNLILISTTSVWDLVAKHRVCKGSRNHRHTSQGCRRAGKAYKRHVFDKLSGRNTIEDFLSALSEVKASLID